MSDYNRNTRIPGSPNRPVGGRSSGSWLAGIVIAVLVIIAVGYAFSDRWMGNNMVEHRATATDTAPSASPATLAPAPSATPKP
jgi:hypothetical protein